jgi:cold-inducible RNA-binding protein
MNIYVGNLSYNTTETDLREAFSPFGAVDSARIITDKFSGQAKGFGFVEMSNPAEAKAAITGLDGKDLNGRSIKVNEAQPKNDNRTGGGGGGYGGGGGNRGGGSGGGGGSRW